MIGIDIVLIERIKKAVEMRGFKEHVFTPAEISYAAAKSRPEQTLAGIYAAKEAVAKALGHGFKGINHIDIEITHNAENRPCAIINGREIEVSISHDGEYAVASAYCP